MANRSEPGKDKPQKNERTVSITLSISETAFRKLTQFKRERGLVSIQEGIRFAISLMLDKTGIH